jgi:DNA ligase (NAD+)
MKELLGSCAYVGEPLKIFKANMIIPQVKEAGPKYNYGEVVAAGGVSANDVIEICPCCGGAVSIIESAAGVQNLVCENPNCEGKLQNRIDHFCGKKGLDIKGISKATIEKLIDWGWINGLADVFRLNEHKAEWVAKPGFGAASVGKILNNIDAAKCGAQLVSFISAIGIPLVGRTVAKEIVRYHSSWADFKEAVGGDWTEFEGFGPEISKAINNFDYSEADEIAGMLTFKQPEVQNEVAPVAAIKDKVFCITGKVHQFKNRDELKVDIESLGGKVVGSMSSKVNYLINNDNTSTSTKNKAAQAAGIPIITEEEYLKMKY